MNLHGIFAALTTPFDSADNVALAGVSGNIARYNQTGLAGYLVIASTGESVLLRHAEIEKLLETVREAAAPGRILIAGTGAESTAETIARSKTAAKLGYHCALVQTPHFFKPMLTADAYVEHYHRIADASPIPLLLYSVPQFTGVALEAELVARLAAHPNIIGMKDSSGNVARLGEIIAAVPQSFQILTGSASMLYPSMVLGASGGILGLADFLPELCVDLYELASANDADKARKLQRRAMIPSNRIVGQIGIAGVKYAMECRGYYGGPVRRPLLPLSESQKQEVESILSSFAPASAARS